MFIVMENLTIQITGLLLLQINHTVLDMRLNTLKFLFFLMQLKKVDPRYSNVLEPILNPTETTIPTNDRVLIRTNFQLYLKSGTGILQPSDQLHEKSDSTFGPALVTLNNVNNQTPVNNFTDHLQTHLQFQEGTPFSQLFRHDTGTNEVCQTC